MTDILSLDFWQPRLHERFEIGSASGGRYDATLTEIAPLPDRGPSGRAADAARSSFSIVFRVALPIEEPQQMFDIRHPDLGNLGPIFLVPVAEDAQDRYYEAVFN